MLQAVIPHLGLTFLCMSGEVILLATHEVNGERTPSTFRIIELCHGENKVCKTNKKL